MIRLAYPDLDYRDVASSLKGIIDSGWLTKGPRTAKFEEAIQRYIGTKYAVAVSSGTAALHLALLALDIGPGDEVIVPGLTFPATANAVELCGAKAVLADIEQETFSIDPGEVEGKITSNTRAIIPVHQFGNPAAMGRLTEIARKHKLSLVEDAACAMGAKWNDTMCGAIGDMGCFSFHPRKIITTGEGGVVTTNNTTLFNRLKLLREHGMDQQGPERKFTRLGFNYRISDIASALGLAQLEKIEAIIEKRNNLSQEFRELLSKVKGILPVPVSIESSNRSACQSFVVKVEKTIDIFKLITFLKEKGIESTISSTAVHIQPYYREKYGFREDALTNTLDASRSSVALPFHTRLGRDDFVTILSALGEYLGVGNI